MGNSVVWIDDLVNVMKEVVSYVFPSLWEHDITSYICITNKSEDALKELNRIIFDQFVSYLIDKKFIDDDDKIVEREHLVITMPETKDKDIPTADIAVDISDLFVKYKDIIDKIYKPDIVPKASESASEDGQKNDSCSESTTAYTSVNVEKITNDIANKFMDDTWFGIDLCLLEDDYDILTEKKASPVLSMALYNSLINMHRNVFLYTSHIAPTSLIDGWRTIYKQYFDPNCGEITFYNRRGQNALEHDSSNKLIDLIVGWRND